MNINSVLDKIIKILLVSVISIMLTIGFLFITPISVHADDSVNYLEQYKRDINDFRLTYSYPNMTFLSSNASAYGMFSLTEPFPVSSGDVLTLYCNEVYPDSDCSISVYAGTTYLTSFKLDSVRSVDYTFSSSYTNVTIRIQNYAYSVSEYPYSFDLTEYFSVVPSSSLGGGSSDYIEAYTDVKAGYVAYILVEEGTTIELTTQFPEYSRAKYPYWDSVARYNEGLSDLPTEGTTFTDTTGFSINWDKLSTDTNAFGQAKTGYVIFTDISAGYFVVYNPTYRNVTNDGRQLIAPTIRVWTSDTYGVAQFPIQTRVSLSDQGMTWLSTQVAGGYVATSEDYDATADEWRYHYPNSTESAIIPNGGGNALPADMSIQEYLQSIGNTLSGLVNDFLSIFAAPLNYIQSLISAGSAFMTSISQFFVWLPAPVYTLLVTALILVIVIGVIKLLFK